MQDETQAQFEECGKIIARCKSEMAKRVVGQDALVDGILTAFIAGGHILVEGAPGLAKTLAARAFAEISGLDFKRIQFTPDLLPADISGSLFYEQTTGKFSSRKGPVFANVILADEINRAGAKVQSALLEAMEERQVTIGDESLPLPDPFFVMATQNPIEQEGTFDLPESETDRFLMKLEVPYPSREQETEIVKTCGAARKIPVQKILDRSSIALLKDSAASVACGDAIARYIVSIVAATRPSEGGGKSGMGIDGMVALGASPRAGIALLACAKVRAIFEGRSFVLPEDVQALALGCLRHRLVMSYEAAARGVGADEIISRVIAAVPLP